MVLYLLKKRISSGIKGSYGLSGSICASVNDEVIHVFHLKKVVFKRW